VGNDQFVVLYDASAGMELDCRTRGVDLELKQQWEKRTPFASLMVDQPAISPVSEGGFVLAGCDMIVDKEKKIARRECRTSQYDAHGKIISSIAIPVLKEAFLHTRVACGADSAYVAFQTNGRVPYDAKEASVFKIPLDKQDP
jgi:hypothetical protein